MKRTDNAEEAVEILQQLGLKEYEAKCFVGLTRLSTGTAKQLAEVTDVPRTRVYDAVRVLEAQGLVEVQHTSPQQFRATPLEEAMETLHGQYETRVDRLGRALDEIDDLRTDDESHVQEVWAMTGASAIEGRANKVVSDASDEVVLVVGDGSLLTDRLVDTLNALPDDVDLVLGALTPDAEEHAREQVPAATTFVTGLEWLRGPESDRDEAAIGRLLLVDRATLLVSSLVPDTGKEQAIFGTGFGNGLVVIARRLMSQGLLVSQDPGQRT